MKKLLVLALLAAAGYGVYAFVLRPPAKRTCMRVAELCGFDPRGEDVNRCVETLDSLKQSSPGSVERVTTCMADAKSCGEATGCAAGVVLPLGASFLQDVLKGMQKSAK